MKESRALGISKGAHVKEPKTTVADEVKSTAVKVLPERSKVLRLRNQCSENKRINTCESRAIVRCDDRAWLKKSCLISC